MRERQGREGGGGADPLQAELLRVVSIAHQSGEARRRRARGARAELQQLRTLRSRAHDSLHDLFAAPIVIALQVML
jgi:hypothetical protein